jgi:EAL domain-containing protein (putative c-di-GMP-specific phosphodiesterase class I)
MDEHGAQTNVLARAPRQQHRRPRLRGARLDYNGFHPARHRPPTDIPDPKEANAMISTAYPPSESRFHRPLLERLEREHFPASQFTEPQPGTIAAQFFASRLTSAFQPIVRACDDSVAGHHALLRVFDGGAHAVAPWRLLAHAAGDAMLVQLDRLARTLHALNYFSHHDTNRHLLYLNIEERLLSLVADHHGTYFELILEQLGVPTNRIAIVLPAGVLDDPVTFVRAAIAYRIRGYRVVAQLSSAADADLEHIFLAEPHDVALDAPQADRIDEMRRFIVALSRRGIHAIARRIEDEPQAQAARDVGFGFLQGWHFAAPDARPSSPDSRPHPHLDA